MFLNLDPILVLLFHVAMHMVTTFAKNDPIYFRKKCINYATMLNQSTKHHLRRSCQEKKVTSCTFFAFLTLLGLKEGDIP